MDQRERIGNFEEGIRSAIDGYLLSLFTALPGFIISFDPMKMLAVIQVTIQFTQTDEQGNPNVVTMAPLVDVPVIFPNAGGFALTFPLAAGDEVLVIFASRCIDGWWQNSGVQPQAEFRMHDLSDGFAIPGPKSLPNVIPSISTNSVQLRTLDGTCYVELAAGGVINLVAPGGVNIMGTLNVSKAVTLQDTLTVDDDATIDGVDIKTHTHSGVQTGSGDTGPPT